MKPRRKSLALIAACGAAILVSGCGGTTQQTQTVAGPTSTTPRVVHKAAAVRAARPSAAELALRRNVGSLARALGPHAGILVRDVSSGRDLYSLNPNFARPPASVEKLYTSAAMLATVGPNAVIHTQVLGSGHLGPHGVWYGNLYLRGNGDPTFGDPGFQRIYEEGQGSSIASLIAQLHRSGIRRVSGYLYPDASIFDSRVGGPHTKFGPDPGDYGGQMSALVYDHGLSLAKMGPALTAAHVFAQTAERSGVMMRSRALRGRAPHGLRLLASVSSPPMATMLRQMDVPSDDLFADLFAKQLGHRYTGWGTLSAGAAVIARTIDGRYRLHAVIHDGSGLDKTDASTPRQIVSLLTQLTPTAAGRIIRGALPVLGVSGTTKGMGLKTPAVGRCQAKTGSLDSVTNLAGWCQALNGHTLAFAIFDDGPPNWQADVNFGKIAGAIAAYGASPARPSARSGSGPSRRSPRRP
ncbi:MAG: D-alanyl-D-alanine carboxypeptidase [Solirubrobacterales bacterium]|nr:D-alanyl-D-alanine carboxypeptidase [Solirubrobacterales bacterium]